jgi:hypothetical protein
MAQTNVPSRLAATYLGLETTYGSSSGATMVRATPFGEVDLSGLARAQLEVDDEQTRGHKYITPVHGLKSDGSGAKLVYAGKVPTTRLVAAASPDNHPLGVILRGLWGNDSGTSYNAAAGTTVAAAGSTTSAVEVASATGRVVGEWIGVEVSSALEFRRIKSISGTTLNVYPNFSGTPTATTGIVVGGYTYAPAQAHTTSLVLQHAKATDSTHQWEVAGCTGDLELTYARGEIVRFGVDLKAATWTGPSSQGFSTTAATDGMTAPLATQGATTLVQALATTTTTHYALEAMTVKFAGGMMHLLELGGTEGTTGVMRVPARPFAEGTIEFRSDPSRSTSDWASQTKLGIIVIIPTGSGTTKRAIVVDLPTVVLVGAPKYKEKGGRLVTECAFKTLEDESTSGATTDLALAAARIALI